MPKHSSDVSMDVGRYLKVQAALVNTWLDELVRGEVGDPAVIWDAMRYSILGGGKRFRPVLLLAVGETLDRPREIFKHTAVAIECIHTYSLIHDDLPAMDNDDLRRGQPTCHIRYGEATAILAGDALLTLAFELLARCPYLSAHPDLGLRVVRTLAHACGVAGLVGGQVRDLEKTAQPVTESEVMDIHRRKTAALIRATVEIGAMMAGADRATARALSRYGEALGIAFQISDDILDMTQPSEKLGKTAGKDDLQVKPTLPRAVGLEAAQAALNAWVQRALAAVEDVDRLGILRALARFIREREQ